MSQTFPSTPAGSGLRLSVGLPLAAIVTAILFLAMGALIRGDGTLSLGETRDVPVFKLTPDRIETEIMPEMARPDLPEASPPEPAIREWEGPSERTLTVAPATRPETMDPGTFEISQPGLAGAVLQFQPAYPDRCAARGLEGSVTVRFDVTAAGAVVNPVVVNSTSSCFDRAAIQAISKWKFQPSASGGGAVAQRGLTKTFRFELQG